MIPDANELAQISGALLSALAEARAMADAGNYGAGFADLVQHARELYQLIADELAAAGDAGGEYARGLVGAMGDKLVELDTLLHRGNSR